MAFLDLGYKDQFEGKTKAVFRDSDLVYAVKADEPMDIIGDEDWYDMARLQVEVWNQNIESFLEEDIPLTFNEYDNDIMIYDITDDRIDGKVVTPAIRIPTHIETEPYGFYETFEDIPRSEERQIREIQQRVDNLIQEGKIAFEGKDNTENDLQGSGCLRQFGRDSAGNVYLLDFGEYHHQLEGPIDGEEFLQKHGIERKNSGINSPVLLK